MTHAFPGNESIPNTPKVSFICSYVDRSFLVNFLLPVAYLSLPTLKETLTRMLAASSQDFDRILRHVVEDPDIVPDPQAVLRAGYPPRALDPALAHFRGFMPQMTFNAITHLGANTRIEGFEIFDGFR